MQLVRSNNGIQRYDNRIFHSGGLGYALNFGSDAQTVSYQKKTAYEFQQTSEFTFCCWVRWNQNIAQFVRVKSIFSFYSNDFTPYTRGCNLLVYDYPYSTFPALLFINGTQNTATTRLEIFPSDFGTFTHLPNQWHCFIVTKSAGTGIGAYTWYVNGVQKASTTSLNDGLFTIDYSEPQHYPRTNFSTFGVANFSNLDYLGNLHIYNRALTPSEAAHYFRFCGGIPPTAQGNLIDAWHCDQRSGDELLSRSTGNNGLLGGFTQTTPGAGNAWKDAYTLNSIL